MPKRLPVLAMAVLLSFSLNAFSQEQKLNGCSDGEGTGSRELRDGYRLVVGPAADSCRDGNDFTCKATVLASDGRTIATMCDHAAMVEWVTEVDMEGDGKLEIVVETYSGGAHCCPTYWVVTRGNKGGILAELFNQTSARFDSRPGGAEVFTRDGAFDYFEFSHADNVMPDMFLRLKDGVWIDTSREHVRHYDEQILEARKKLTKRRIARLRAVRVKDSMLEDDLIDIRRAALTVVLAYLYSGRERQAWEALQGYWPAWDYSRIKADIERTRRSGLTAMLGTNGMKKGDD